MKTVLFLVVGLLLNVSAHAELGKMDKARCEDLAEKVKQLKGQPASGTGTQNPEEPAASGDITTVQ
jgi:hypothetical protein